MADLPTTGGDVSRAVRRPRYASRGQALVIAVLVMFILAGLAGVFIALINFAIVQTATMEERTKLESIVHAGLEQAKAELLNNSDGYDWRPDNGPDANNPGWHFSDGGFYRIKVRYGPSMIFGEDAANPGYNGALQFDANYHFLDNPMDRYLQISVDAQFALDNPPDTTLRQNDEQTYTTYRNGFLNPRRFIERHLTAYMPVGLTDYCRWETNMSGAQEPVVVAPTVALGDIPTVKVNPDTASEADLKTLTNQTTISSATAYFIFEGPFRAETDTDLGQAAFYETNPSETTTDTYAQNYYVRRRDLVEIVGKLQAYDEAAETRKVMVNIKNRALTSAANLGEANLDMLNVVNSATALQYVQTLANDPIMRHRRAPDMSAVHPVTGIARYLQLTAYSGEWLNGSALNTGMLGQGEGLYIPNDDQDPYQGTGDLDSLRAQWLNSSAENWESGIYKPDRYAIEVTLNDWGIGTAQVDALPYIALRDRTGKKRFTDPKTGQPTDHVNVDYPRNGVIYAPGNLIVKGTLPASLAYTGQKNADGTHTYLPTFDNAYYAHAKQLPGGWHIDSAANKPRVDYYVAPTNRRYDLTIVSGGTIYIEGNLTGPATRTEKNPPASRIMRGSVYDSKLALLALDNVCLNPTASVSVASNLLTGGTAPNTYFWAFNQNPISVSFATAREIRPRTSLLLRHAGQWTNANDTAYIRMAVNGQDYTWNTTPPLGFDRRDLLFCTRPQLPTLFPTLTQNDIDTKYFPDESNRAANNGYGSWGGGLYGNNVDPFNAQVWSLTDPTHMATALNDYGGLNTLDLRWQPGPQSTTPYLCMADIDNGGPMVTGIDLQIDALIYAQRGSWFIIPGAYYNNDPNSTLLAPFPQYQEPLDVTITINGAITEDRPAPIEAEEAWTQHWRGANLYWYTGAAGTPAQLDPGADATSWDPVTWRWKNRRVGIIYQYDATLARPVCFDVYPNDDLVYYRPRLPKLPACPDVFSLGEMRNG